VAAQDMDQLPLTLPAQMPRLIKARAEAAAVMTQAVAMAVLVL